MNLTRSVAALALILITPEVFAQNAALPDAVQAMRSLRVFPSEISLSDGSDWQRLLILAERADGSTQDFTASASCTTGDPSIVKLDGGLVQPVANGATEIHVSVDGLKVIVPVSVTNVEVVPELSFRTDVLATLTKAGCNTGKCHGSASGKDGFRLSLFGYDPAGDHYRLTRELPGRRINLVSPQDSLLINKALNNVDHTGGQLIEEASHEYEILLAWLPASAMDPIAM